VSAPIDPRTPCLIGVAQRTYRRADGLAPEPLVQWEQVVRAAAADTGARADVLASLDSLQIVFCQTWAYDDPVGRLAERLSISPRHRLYSGIGGTTPQVLVQEAAAAILRGELDTAVVCGAEALDTVRRLRKAGERPSFSYRDPERKPYPFEAPFHPAEVAHEVSQAWLTFTVWDIARRAHRRTPLGEYRAELGRMMAPMTAVAATNPNAWFPTARSADELITATPDNRMVAYPYTKYMCSVIDVDMAAAVIVASEAAADRLGVPAEQRVYLRGWCYATDPVYVAEHEPMWASPAMEAASREALSRAGVGIDDIAHLDLYSCFASSLNLARDALGLRDEDPRPLTVTGGLPFAGGAASDYMSHALATMAGVLRADPGSLGLVSGVGMHMTKHVFAVYSTTPAPVVPPDERAVQSQLDARPRRAITEVATGPATVAAATAVHGREGPAEWGLAVCDLPDGSRAYARISDADLLADVERTEWVGRTVDLVPGPRNTNVVKSAR